jgi:hypothetical protein
MEPATTTASGFALSKIYYALSSLFMATVVLFLRKHPTLKNYSRTATAAIVGGTSVGASVVFGGSLAVWLGMKPDDANTAMALGGAIGLVSFTAIQAVVRLLDKWEDKDIIEVAGDVKAAVTTLRSPAPPKAQPKAPAKKRAPRKTPAKRKAAP